MKPFTLFVLSVVALGLFVLSLAGGWFTSTTFDRMASDYVRAAKQAQQGMAQNASDMRLTELIRTTVDGRARLDSLSQTDILAAVKIIESVATIARIDLHVTGASAANASGKEKNVASVRAVTFSFEAAGTFPRLIHAMQLLSALPMPSVVEQFDMSALTADDDTNVSGAWRATGRIRLLTNATSTP